MRGLIAVVAAGCVVPEQVTDDTAGHGGVAVGNPPQARVSLAAGAPDVAFTSLELPLVGFYLEDCDGVARVVDLPRTVLGLTGGEVELETGRYCAVGLVPDPATPTVLSGEADGGTWTFTNPLGRILLYGDLELVPDQELNLELAEPGWIDAAAFELSPGDHRDIGDSDRCSADPLCERITNALTDQSGLYVDDDADGVIGTEERDRGEDARGDRRGD